MTDNGQYTTGCTWYNLEKFIQLEKNRKNLNTFYIFLMIDLAPCDKMSNELLYQFLIY